MVVVVHYYVFLILQWIGVDANSKERYSSGQFAQDIKSQRGGKPECETLGKFLLLCVGAALSHCNSHGNWSLTMSTSLPLPSCHTMMNNIWKKAWPPSWYVVSGSHHVPPRLSWGGWGTFSCKGEGGSVVCCCWLAVFLSWYTQDDQTPEMLDDSLRQYFKASEEKEEDQVRVGSAWTVVPHLTATLLLHTPYYYWPPYSSHWAKPQSCPYLMTPSISGPHLRASPSAAFNSWVDQT